MRRILILASLAALAAPVATWALEGELTVYGTLMPFVDNSGITGQTKAAPSNRPNQVAASAYNNAGTNTVYSGSQVPRRFRLTSGTSNIGFKGGLDLLGDDLQVFFQVENSVNFDGDSPTSWATRNSAVGLMGKFGRVLFGNWDTPYKLPMAQIAALRGQNPFEDAIIGNPGFGVPATTTQAGRANGKPDAAFSRRQGNSIQYWSPDLHGFSVRLAMSVNEGKTAETITTDPTSGAVTVTPSLSPTLYSGSVAYTAGPVTLRYCYERHADYFGLSQLGGAAPKVSNASSTDEGHEAAVQLSLPTGTKLSAIGERLSYKNDDNTASNVRQYTRFAYFVLAQQRFGDHQLFANFGQALRPECKLTGGGDCSASGLGASQLGAGYSYSVGKSLDLYAAYYQTVNDKSASYVAVNGPGTPLPGGDIRGFGVGMLYTFSATATAGAPKGL